MRYLNKIIFINSAKIKYTEVSIDGNVHFTGTQGVGKSTILRALLFFYNANTLKLGISTGQKAFIDFYLENSNSYVIYEVIRETGAFCVFIFRSNGRIAFRFFDGKFQKNYFIDSEGMAFESSDKIRLALGTMTKLSSKIESYEIYRDIIYGNHQAIEATFRKYAIIESKQFQNIPSTIQNVFLNTKLDAEFIKETIIKSLNEEEISIDLSIHSNHLKGFKDELGDIEKWVKKEKNGEILVKKQAQNVVDINIKIKNIELDKFLIARQIGWTLGFINVQKPKREETLKIENAKKIKLDENVKEFDEKYQKLNIETASKISNLESELKKAKDKQKYYTELNINDIIEQVAQKGNLQISKKALLEEQGLLTSKFKELDLKYIALLQLAENQLKEFENIKGSDKNKENESFQNFKESLNTQFELIFKEIRQSYEEQIGSAKEVLENAKSEISNIRIEQASNKNKRFYEKEIDSFKDEINGYKKFSQNAEFEINQKKSQISFIQQQWDLEKNSLEETAKQQSRVCQEKIENFEVQIGEILFKIENSKDSLYGWLNKNIEGWENTIGKVVDEGVLFKIDLFPKKSISREINFYGVDINLDDISSRVKTVTDYENEIKEIKLQVERIKQEITDLGEGLVVKLNNLRKKYQLKINENKEIIGRNEYLLGQYQTKLDEAQVKLNEFTEKADKEKKGLLKKNESDLVIAEAAKQKVIEALNSLEKEQNTDIEEEKRNKVKRQNAERQRVDELINKIDGEITGKRIEIETRKKEINFQRNSELANEGAQTEKLKIIDDKLKIINDSLSFIEENSFKEIEYKKDKRELFDKVDEYKRQKEQLEIKQANSKVKYENDKQKLQEKIDENISIIQTIAKEINRIGEDLEEYEKFKTIEGFEEIEFLIQENKTEGKTDKRCKDLIGDFRENNHQSVREFQDLQIAVNRFNGNFSAQNLFKFKTNLTERTDYFQFANNLKDFLDDDKFTTIQKKVGERFASIVKRLGSQTGELLSKETEIAEVITKINNDFVRRNFAGVIKSIELKTEKSSNPIVQLLIEIKKFNDENIDQLGEQNLFSQNNQDSVNQKAVEYLTALDKAISDSKNQEITLSDSFELAFRIKENDNDTGWVTKLASVGSDGTDILVKAMINIMLLNVFKERATKNRSQDFKLHCMMDEIGKLHSSNVKGILQFANDRNIILINSSPESMNPLAYKYTYHLSKDNKSVTTIKPILTNRQEIT